MLILIRSSGTDLVQHPSTNSPTAIMTARMAMRGQIPRAFNTEARSSSRAFRSRKIG